MRSGSRYFLPSGELDGVVFKHISKSQKGSLDKYVVFSCFCCVSEVSTCSLQYFTQVKLLVFPCDAIQSCNLL